MATVCHVRPERLNRRAGTAFALPVVRIHISLQLARARASPVPVMLTARPGRRSSVLPPILYQGRSVLAALLAHSRTLLAIKSAPTVVRIATSL